MNQGTVLVVEDDPTLREALCDTLELGGFRVERAADGGAALECLIHTGIDMVVSDVQMRPMDGYTLLQRIKERSPRTPVLLMTAYGSVEKAVSAMRSGAADYLAKPFDPELLLQKVEHALLPAVVAENHLVAEDIKSRELLQLAARVAQCDATVMIGGESGTGKEVFARFIHRHSTRRDNPFIALNCAAIPENMLEAVLFGHEKGAFTSAYQSAPGKFEQAQSGTLLLDEISELSLPLQAKLLRVLQEREVERVGGRKLIQLDVRVLATSNKNLREEVAAGRFREDLYYRLNVFPLTLPPLRERIRDLLPLARFLLQRHAAKLRIAPPILSTEVEEHLLQHRWPGNVRELDNVIQRALILCNGGNLTPSHLFFEADQTCLQMETDLPGQRSLNDNLRSTEEQIILDALREGNGSRKNAAEMLGISQRTLRYKIARLREAGVAIPG
ncbi:MAG: sigma-54-dependent Fis family transcriptional regulator [Gammaproteobacteria bacterium]|nr:sigma-54-dependent Fis family transcriptional regulator [Gammaproteobacteria bacterium]MCP5418230.1 sigma-54-dependent Fis family transcriptional regulator [Chromatiaceae bacterium]